jgi:hypothetical protein
MSTEIWNEGEAPKDGGSYVAIGHISWGDNDGGGADPFTAIIHWDGQMWLNESDMALAYGCNDNIRIFYWIRPPWAEDAKGGRS